MTDGSLAAFGQPGANADFTIRCVFATKGIILSRAGSVAENGSGQMTMRAAGTEKSYNVSNGGGIPPYASVGTSASDPQLDAIAFSRGRFFISMNGVTDLVIPDWPELARVVEDCRGP